MQPDGKLVAAGCFFCGQVDIDFALARYLPDGRLDASFGVGGTVTTNFGDFSQAHALVLQPDGKLVAAGRSLDLPSFTDDFALARYLPDGRLDATFGTGGRVTTDFGSMTDFALALVLQLDDKLVAAGFSNVSGPNDFALARYHPDGRLDATFGVGGRVTTDFGGLTDAAGALVLQPDGKLVAAGETCAEGGAVTLSWRAISPTAAWILHLAQRAP